VARNYCVAVRSIYSDTVRQSDFGFAYHVNSLFSGTPTPEMLSVLGFNEAEVNPESAGL